MPYLQLSKYRIYYEERNPASKRVLLFLHGIPVDSTLWKGVMDGIGKDIRMIAPDLIGFGKSDKPLDITYDIHTYTNCLKEFIDTMKLKEFVLVAMDLGLMAGLNYFAQERDRVAGIVMMEGMVTDLETVIGSQRLPARCLMKCLKKDSIARKMFVDNGLSTVRNMISGGSFSKQIDLSCYAEHFKSIELRRKVLFEGLASNQIAKGVSGTGIGKVVHEYAKALEESSVPKLLLHANPGAAVSPKLVAYLSKRIRNLETGFVGKGKHYLPFDQPERITDFILGFLSKESTPAQL